MITNFFLPQLALPKDALSVGSPQGGSHDGEALGLGDPLLPGAAGVGGGSGPRHGAGDSGRIQHRQKGAFHALAIIYPGRPLFDPMTSVCLTGRAAHRGPPPSGGDT